MRNMIRVLLFCFIFTVAMSGCSKRTEKENRRGDKPQTEQADIDIDVDLNLNEKVKPIINVYIENSGSMYGYVGNNKSDFKSSIYNYLSDIIISDVTDSLNLFYINSEIIPNKPDISDFIENLNPDSFRKKGGSRGDTDISNLISTILKQTNDNVISVLISDFIFSPGKRKDADEYLVNQQIGIKTNIAQALKTKNLGIIVYQLSSEFKGYYYNREDKPEKIDARRPFYIWIIGDVKYVTELQNEIPATKFKGSGVENIFTIVPGKQVIDYSIRNGSGNFSLDKQNPKTKIAKAQKDRNGEISFAVNVDFSKLLLDDEYLKNEANYTLNSKSYNLKIKDSPAKTGKYTHSLNLSSSSVSPTNLTIKLNMLMPEWIEQMNDEEGLNIHKGDSMSKTYGIKYLLNGVYEAYTLKDDPYTEIKISINN